MNYLNVQVLDSADNHFKLLVKEVLHILHKKPSLNVQMNEQANYKIKTLIVANFARINDGVVAP